jgi:hypothetical protein
MENALELNNFRATTINSLAIIFNLSESIDKVLCSSLNKIGINRVGARIIDQVRNHSSQSKRVTQKVHFDTYSPKQVSVAKSGEIATNHKQYSLFDSISLAEPAVITETMIILTKQQTEVLGIPYKYRCGIGVVRIKERLTKSQVESRSDLMKILCSGRAIKTLDCIYYSKAQKYSVRYITRDNQTRIVSKENNESNVLVQEGCKPRIYVRNSRFKDRITVFAQDDSSNSLY